MMTPLYHKTHSHQQKHPFLITTAVQVLLYTTTHYVDTAGTNRLRLFWNSPTNTIFGGFDVSTAPTATAVLFDNTSPAEGGSHPSTFYQVNVTNPNNKKTITFGNSSTAFIQSTQTYPSMPMCSPIQNIVFATSGNLSVSNSQIGNPTIFKSDGDCATQGGADNFRSWLKA